MLFHIITSFNCSKATVDDMSSYSRTADVELRSNNVSSGLMCRDMHCHDVHHLESINLFYSGICSALDHSSAQCIDVCRTGSAKDFRVPGFNEHVKTLHTDARIAYIIWRNIGRLTVWRLASKCARHALHLSIRYDNVSVSRNKKVCTPSKVCDSVGNTAITDMWRNHYSTLLNSVDSSIYKDRVLSYLNDCSSDYFTISISVDDISNGNGYLPDGFMKSVIIPLIKNETGDTNDKNNYSPIALVTAMSKIFELCLSKKNE